MLFILTVCRIIHVIYEPDKWPSSVRVLFVACSDMDLNPILDSDFFLML